jgi:thiamine transporter
MPQGGSVTPFSMMFIVLAGYWLGPVWGIATGVAMGFLDLTTGFTAVNAGSVALDYPVAFGLLGVSGFFRKMKFGLQIGFVAGVFGRFLSVTASGFLFWLDQAPGALWGSITYNAAYILPEAIASLVIISLPVMIQAIDTVTKNVVPPADYAVLSLKNKGSISVNARITTGAIIAAIGGFGFVLANYISRWEELQIRHIAWEVQLFAAEEAPRADRLYRIWERNTEQIFALQTAGIIFLALGAALLISVLVQKHER